MTTHAVWIDGTRVPLTPTAVIGQGGEADVYDLGDGRVVKVWKQPDHPDYEGLPHEQDNARRRLAEGGAKLRALPGHLPAGVVAPAGFALGSKRGDVVGYVMPKIAGIPLHSYGEPRWRRDNLVAGADVVAALLSLHDAIAGLHKVGVVVGDCNDLNVLVDGRRVHLIDVDSYQFGPYACPMFSDRFVDPRLCAAQQLVPVRPHDTDSDWFAFAVMVFRSLLWVGPWGGVARSVQGAARALRRLSVMAADVTYPRAARPLATLPDDVLDAFRNIFERDHRGVFPRALLERLHLRACAACSEEHGRARCPMCQLAVRVPPTTIHGRLSVLPIAIADVAPLAERVGRQRGRAGVWLEGGVLYRQTRLGPERIGNVLAGQTQAWVGASLGVGFYRAGAYPVAFVFRSDRGGLDDRVAMPRIRGQLIAAHATLGTDRAWLWLTCADGGRLVTTCVVIDAGAQVLATETFTDEHWLAGIEGACAAGPYLFVPTELGIARVEIASQTIAVTRLFPETAPIVGTTDRLSISAGSIDVMRRRDALRLQLT